MVVSNATRQLSADRRSIDVPFGRRVEPLDPTAGQTRLSAGQPSEREAKIMQRGAGFGADDERGRALLR
jgi:hypothetical protein